MKKPSLKVIQLLETQVSYDKRDPVSRSGDYS